MKINFLGEKNSIQRKLFHYFIAAVVVIIIFSLIGFQLLVDNNTLHEIIQIIDNEVKIEQAQSIIKRGVFILLLNTVVVSAVVMLITKKTVLDPLKTITEATKKVAKGDFDIELETKRKDEVGELTNNFNLMVKDLDNIEELQKDFMDNVSHEIKTPISSIQGFAKMLERDDLTKEKRKEYSQIIIEESSRLLNLSNNMLKLSKLEHQNKILNKTQINISEQIRKVIVLLEKKWSEKNITFNVDMEEKYFEGDEELMFQVWTNLIDNSIKFSNPNSDIDISLKEDTNWLLVEIKDYGKGMKEEEIKKVFNKFYQIDKSHSSEGFGLGLPITKRIIELSDGQLEIKSKENKGTTIIVKLPIYKSNNKIIVK